MLEKLKKIQTKDSVTKDFRVVTRSTLNIKVFVFSIRQRLKKLTSDTMLRIVATSTYKKIIKNKFKKINKTLTLLKMLITRFKKKTSLKIKNLKQPTSYTVAFWWRLSNIRISKNKKTNKKLHDVMQFNKRKKQLLIYIDENDINQKIEIFVVDIESNITLKAFLNRSLCYTVYIAKLKEIDLTLKLTLRRMKKEYLMKKLIILIDNQTAIRSIADLTKRSKSIIIINIICQINRLRSFETEINFQWLSTHIEIKENERADVATKKVTSWRIVLKRNRNPYEVNINKTAPPATPPVTPSATSSISVARSTVNTYLKKSTKKVWDKNWREETKKRSLYKIIKTSNNSILKIHRELEKWMSSILIQMRTQKIDLNHFLHHRKVSKYDIFECSCERDFHTIMHVLIECSLYYKLRRKTWKKKEKKPEKRIVLNTFQKILTESHFAKKAVNFMKNADLIEQFKDQIKRTNA